jgi:FMNH2-dependent dimethyl sulfone monooxygenase
MKIGMLLHMDRGVDSVLAEARAADSQGYDTVWLFDHLSNPFGADGPDGPHEPFTLMTAVGAVTSNVRLAWAMLNLSFRHPAVLAKMLATLDHITHGRVICAVGSGWFKREYEAYGIPLIDDHDDRAAYGREAIRAMRELWTHPAPEVIDFNGKFIQLKQISFNPAPYTKPHPPIWFGGDSDASLQTVKELADGWVMLTSGNPQRLAEVQAMPDWPKRPMELMKNARIHVGETRQAALDEVAAIIAKGGRNIPATVEEYVAREVVGTPDECAAKLREIESWGITTVRVDCMDAAHQERIARLVIPRVG